MKRTVDWKVVGTIAAMFLVALFFWDWPFLYPIKAFVVLLHEVGHGLAAVATGGEIARIELSANLGGACWSRGGIRLAVLPAGYLGSMVFGGLILVAAARTRFDKHISIGIGVGVLAITMIFVRSAFGLVFGLLFGAAMILAGKLLPHRFNDTLLKFLGVTSSMYAVIDIKEDLISRTVPGSDAWAMSQELFLPPVFWGVLWIVLATVGTAFFVMVAAKGERAAPRPAQKS